MCWNHLGPSTSLRLYEAAGMKISDTMGAGVQEQQREWENRAARRATEEAQKRKATNKQERRSARAEAAKISKKKNHIYNQQHTFDFSETAPVGSEEGKSGKKSGPGSVSQARRKEIMLSGTDEEKNCFWQCSDCQKVYCKKNGKSGLEAHKLKCKHPGNITIGSDDEEEHVEDQTKNTSPLRDNGSEGGADPRDIEEGCGSDRHEVFDATFSDKPGRRDVVMAMRIGGRLTYASVSPQVQLALRNYGVPTSAMEATAAALCD